MSCARHDGGQSMKLVGDRMLEWKEGERRWRGEEKGKKRGCLGWVRILVTDYWRLANRSNQAVWWVEIGSWGGLSKERNLELARIGFPRRKLLNLRQPFSSKTIIHPLPSTHHITLTKGKSHQLLFSLSFLPRVSLLPPPFFFSPFASGVLSTTNMVQFSEETKVSRNWKRIAHSARSRAPIAQEFPPQPDWQFYFRHLGTCFQGYWYFSRCDSLVSQIPSTSLTSDQN